MPGVSLVPAVHWLASSLERNASLRAALNVWLVSSMESGLGAAVRARGNVGWYAWAGWGSAAKGASPARFGVAAAPRRSTSVTSRTARTASSVPEFARYPGPARSSPLYEVDIPTSAGATSCTALGVAGSPPVPSEPVRPASIPAVYSLASPRTSVGATSRTELRVAASISADRPALKAWLWSSIASDDGLTSGSPTETGSTSRTRYATSDASLIVARAASPGATAESPIAGGSPTSFASRATP